MKSHEYSPVSLQIFEVIKTLNCSRSNVPKLIFVTDAIWNIPLGISPEKLLPSIDYLKEVLEIRPFESIWCALWICNKKYIDKLTQGKNLELFKLVSWITIKKFFGEGTGEMIVSYYQKRNKLWANDNESIFTAKKLYISLY